MVPTTLDLMEGAYGGGGGARDDDSAGGGGAGGAGAAKLFGDQVGLIHQHSQQIKVQTYYIFLERY